MSGRERDRMIHQVKIDNFQSHKDTTLNLHPGVNVILGPSDNGKSALFRAICWALYNRPLGDEFCSYWAEKTQVTVLFKEPGGLDTEIIRAKGKQLNSYWLNGQEFKAFGADVPPDVLRLHNMDPDLNVQSQISPFFLLQGSSGEVAKYFNKVARLEDIDQVTKHLDQHSKTSRNKVAQAQVTIERYQDQLERYQALPDIQRMLLQTEGMVTNQENLQTQARGLIHVLTLIQQHSSRQEQLAGVERITRQMGVLDGLLDTREKLEEQARGIARQIEQVQTLEQEIQQAQREVGVLPLVQGVLEQLAGREVLGVRASELNWVLMAIKRAEDQLEKTTRQLEIVQARFTREMGKQCPLCGQKIGEVEK